MELNPELQHISCITDLEKETLVSGIASHFPPEDIQYFIETLHCGMKNE